MMQSLGCLTSDLLELIWLVLCFSQPLLHATPERNKQTKKSTVNKQQHTGIFLSTKRFSFKSYTFFFLINISVSSKSVWLLFIKKKKSFFGLILPNNQLRWHKHICIGLHSCIRRELKHGQTWETSLRHGESHPCISGQHMLFLTTDAT